VGVIFGFMSVIQAIGFMFGMGAGSIMARKLGARDPEAASRTASTAVIFSVGTGLLLSLITLPLKDQVVRFLGSTETILPHARSYLDWILIAAPFMTGGYTLNNLLRFQGKASLGMIGLMSGALLNIALDPILMFGLNLGVAGAAIATGGSQILSFLILLSMFLRGKTEVRLSPVRVDPRPAMVGNIIATGLPSLLRQALNSAATIILNSSAAPFGDGAVAAMSIVSRISFFVFALALGIGQGFQPVAAFNYGAKKYARLRKAFWVTVVMSESVILVSAAVCFLLSGDLIRVFRDDPRVVEIGTRALRLQMGTIIFLPFTMCTEMLYQSVGRRLACLRSGIPHRQVCDKRAAVFRFRLCETVCYSVFHDIAFRIGNSAFSPRCFARSPKSGFLPLHNVLHVLVAAAGEVYEQYRLLRQRRRALDRLGERVAGLQRRYYSLVAA
jgi:putative MATE family efflux protein